MSHIIRFSFFTSSPRSSAPSEPKITEERRLTGITPSSSGKQRSGQRGPAPPAAPPPSLLSPALFTSGYARFKTRFLFTNQACNIRKSPSKSGRHVHCQPSLRGNFRSQVKREASEQFDMIRLRIMQTGYTTESWSITSLNDGRSFPRHPIIWLRICFAIKDARFVHN